LIPEYQILIAGIPNAKTMRMPTNKNKNKVILVTGGTGHQGGAALRHLSEKGFGCRALTRDPNSARARALVGRGTEIVRGDMEDPATLSRALEGVYGVYAVQTPYESGVDAEVRQGFHLVDAAHRAGVSHFVYSSVASADRNTRIPHFDSKFLIEEHLRGTGMHYTIVRPVFFMENWLDMRHMIEAGSIALPLDPATRLQMVAVDDIGGVVAMAFERSGKWQGRAFEVAGDELSMTELAEATSRSAGIDVQYRVDGTPTPGKPTVVVVVLSGVVDPAGGAVWFTADPTLGLDSSAAAATLAAGSTVTLNVTVVPGGEGAAYLNVFTRQRGAVSSTSIPIRTGAATAPRASSALKDAADGDKVVPMQVK